MSELQQTFAEIQSDIGDKEEYSLAISKLEKIILTDPNNSEAYYLMGLAYHRDRKDEIAIPYLIKSLIADPKNSSSASRLEYCLIRCSVHPDVEKLAQYVEMLPNSSDFSYFRGLFFYYTGKYEFAIIEYSKAFENNLKNTELHNKIADCYNKIGQCDKAVVEYQTYLKISNRGSASEIYIKIALMFIKSNRFNDALVFFNEFVNTAQSKPEDDMRHLCFPYGGEDFYESLKICAGVFNSAPENWSAFACGVILELIAVNIKEK
jgi:tetratricopeptide (TPR) repeat protein